VLESVSAFMTQVDLMNDQLPIVFIPTDAVTAQSTHGAVGGIWQSVITPRKVLINESTIKQQLYL